MENPIHRQPLFESSVDGYHFKLSFDKTPLHVGQAVMGKIDITDAKENPVHTLEPLWVLMPTSLVLMRTLKQ